MFIRPTDIYQEEELGAEASADGATSETPVDDTEVSNTPEGDFDDIMGDDDDVDTPAATTEEIPEKEVVETTNTTPDPQASTTPAPQEATPAEPSTAEAQTVDLNNLTPEQIELIRSKFVTEQPAEVSEAEQQAQALEQYSADVANLTQFYTLNEEERAQLESDPAEALPVLAAKMHYQVVNAVTQGIMNVVPNVIGEYMQQQKTNETLQQQFFDRWKQLDPEKHMDDVMRLGQVYRQTNPTASFEQFINDVGSQIVLLHNLVQVPNQQAQPQAPAAQQSTVLPPDQPSGVGTGVQSQATVTSPTNMWEEFASELIED